MLLGAELRALGPKHAVPVPEVPVASLPELPWHAVTEPVPDSRPSGATFDVVFVNRTAGPVEVCWRSPDGSLKSYGRIAKDEDRRQSTRPGAVWIIRDEREQTLGHFVVGDRSSRAVIPAP